MAGPHLFTAGSALYGAGTAFWCFAFLRLEVFFSFHTEWFFNLAFFSLVAGLLGSVLLVLTPRNAALTAREVRKRARASVILFVGAIAALFALFAVDLLIGLLFLLGVPLVLMWTVLPTWSKRELKTAGAGFLVLLVAHIISLYAVLGILAIGSTILAAFILAASIVHPALDMWRSPGPSPFNQRTPLPPPVQK